MENITIELVAKAKATKSAEELLALAKGNGIELTEEEANTYFEQLHTNAALSDDELEAVAGGGICESLENFLQTINNPNASSTSYSGDKSDKPIYDSSIMPLPHNSRPYDPNDKNQIKFL